MKWSSLFCWGTVLIVLALPAWTLAGEDSKDKSSDKPAAKSRKSDKKDGDKCPACEKLGKGEKCEKCSKGGDCEKCKGGKDGDCEHCSKGHDHHGHHARGHHGPPGHLATFGHHGPSGHHGPPGHHGPGPHGPPPMMGSLSHAIVFRTLDFDGDGTIKTEEVRMFIQGLKMIDDDEDGELSRHEFADARLPAPPMMPRHHRPHGPPPFSHHFASHRSHRHHGHHGKGDDCEKGDCDKDGCKTCGKGDSKCRMAAWSHHGRGHHGPSHFAHHGRGGDGPTPFGHGGPQEWMKRIGEWREKMHAHFVAKWKEADTDKDGNISRKEAIARLNEHFDKVDANSDDEISPEEVRTAMAAAFKKHAEQMHGKKPAAGKSDDAKKAPAEKQAEVAKKPAPKTPAKTASSKKPVEKKDSAKKTPAKKASAKKPAPKKSSEKKSD